MIPTKANEEEPTRDPIAPDDPVDPIAAAREAALRARLTTRPNGTRAILAAILGVYALETVLGGGDSLPVLNALGGLNHDEVFAGQVWRVVSYSFLHAGFIHIAMNAWVLWIVGVRVEQMLGTARLVVLYTAAVIGGGLMSLFTSGASVTVGASGGLFGLLAAESIFVFTSRSHLLPEAVRAARQRGAVINLVLNLGISLQPHVSLSAHAGGAIIGAGLMLLGFAPHAEDANTKAPVGVRAVAAGCVALLAVALACGLGLSGARELVAGPRLVRTTLPELGWSAEMPAALAAHGEASTSGGVVERAFGDIERDPAVVAIARIARDDVASAEHDSLRLAEFETAMSAAPPQSTVLGVTHTVVGDRPALIGRYSYPSGVVLQRFVVLRTTDIARVDTIAWPAFEPAYADAASHIAASIQPL